MVCTKKNGTVKKYKLKTKKNGIIKTYTLATKGMKTLNEIQWESFTSTNLGSNSWTDIIYGDKFVSIGANGKAATSTNSTTWSTSTITSYNWNRLLYGNNKYIAIGFYSGNYNYYIMTSTSGSSWSAPTNFGTNAYNCGAYGNGKYILITLQGYISKSTDANTWSSPTSSSLSGATNWKDVVYDGTKFIALNLDGKIGTSDDGDTWSSPTQRLNSGYSWTRLVYGDGVYVALDNSGYISTSTDITNWTTPIRNSIFNNYGTYNPLQALAFYNNKFYLLDQYGNINSGYIKELQTTRYI